MLRRPTPIAIVGVSALFPGSTGAHGFWRDILAGRDLITDVPAGRWLIEDHFNPDPRAVDKTYCRRGAFLGDIAFDPIEFGVPPSAVKATDTSQLLALIVAKQVLDDALQGQFSETARERASVILGVTSGQELIVEASSRLQRPVWVKALRESGIEEEEVAAICDRIADSYTPWQENTFPGLLGNVIAGRIANRFDLGGSNFVTDAACASSLSALSMGCAELQLGHSDLVIAGGVDTFNDITMFVCFSKTPALSPTGDCRPFAKNADGTILGEGLAMFALMRLEDAEREGNRIYAVVRGIGSSSDGRSKSIYAPRPEGQMRALWRAYEQAGYGPETVELVEAHGTGTIAGDAAEFESLQGVFAPVADGRTKWCALGSVKAQVGHTKAAAGAAGMFKAVMALHHKVLPSTLKVEEPNPALQVERSPFYLNTQTRPWIRGGDHPRRASLSSFGFGGTNFHIAFEEYSGPAARPPLRWTPPSELILLCGASPRDLATQCEHLAGNWNAETLSELASRTQLAFDLRASARLAIVAENGEEFSRRLRSAAQSLQSSRMEFSPGVYFNGAADEPGRTAFLFPGQGSQYLGMTADLAIAFPEAREVWDRAADYAGSVFPPPTFSENERTQQKRALTATAVAQPTIGLASAAILAVLRKVGLQPDAVAGHSFGEISALCAAGAFDTDTLAAIARRRGELMADAAGSPAGMLAVADDPATLQSRLGEWALPVVVANHNTPLQSVVSGELEPLREVERRLVAAGVKVARLDVATAFHSPVVAAAAHGFGEFLRSVPFDSPKISFYPNSGEEPTGAASSGKLSEMLAAQIALPVRFVDLVRRMHHDGIRTFVEVGPGGVLTSFVRTILEGLPHRAIATDRPGQNGLTSLWHALGQLAVSGVAIDWKRLREGYEIEKAPNAGAQNFTMSLSGGNYGRPYPPAGGANALPKPVAKQESRSDAGTDAIEAYRIFQETVSNAHRTWQEHLAKGHGEVIRALESAYFAAVGQPVPAALASAPAPAPAPPALTLAMPAPVAMPHYEQRVVPIAAPVFVTPSAAPRPPVEVAQKASARDMLWAIVAEKTGYPAEMLEPAMALEADLGIDSIKRVEIFSAIQDRLSMSIEFDPAAMAELRTLGDIVRRLDSVPSAAAPAPVTAPVTTLEEDKQLVLSLIAEKTGYPVDMLDPKMALEADLGIDSIKRVEIFSALQDRRPHLPEDSAALARLRTIADVIGLLDTTLATAQVEPTATIAPAPKHQFRLNVVRRDAPRTGHTTLDHLDGPVAVVGAGNPIAEALVRRMNQQGHEALAVEQVPVGCRAAIFLAALKHPLTEEEAIAANRQAFVAARSLSANPAMFVTVQDTGGDFHPGEAARAWTGGVAGISRTAALEWPGARVKAIDIDTRDRDPEDVAASLLQELTEGGPETDVGLNAWGHRVTLATEPADATGGSLDLERHAFVIATGGARGVTAASLLQLARTRPLRLLLLGRTPLDTEPAFCAGREDQPSLNRAFLEDARKRGVALENAELTAKTAAVLSGREIRANLDAIRRTGSEVRYECVDIRDAGALSALVSGIRQEWGPVSGIVHGAGVLADKRIEDLSVEQFDLVFSTKVAGLQALLATTSDDPLAFIAIFSSVAARSGNPGQAAYAAANEAMNRAAHAESHRRMGATKVKALNWGPWDGGMVTPALKRLFAERNVPLLGLNQGAELFTEELFNGMSEDVEVVLGALPSPGEAPLRVLIRRDSHPFFDSHRIQDVPVFPVVGALDLFLRASRKSRNGGPAVCRNLRVLRGIRLERYENGGDPLTVKPNANGGMEISGSGGTRHYEATLNEAHHEADVDPSAQALGSLSPSPWLPGDIYGSLLFHGPAFRVIQSIEGVSADGIAGTLTGSQSMRWTDPYRTCDAAMLDGGLQLARLWGMHAIGRPSLPAHVGAIRILQTEDTADPVRCEVRARTSQSTGFVCDISWTSASGRLLATMDGVEMYAMPEME